MAIPMYRISRQAMKNVAIFQNCGRIAGVDIGDTYRGEQRPLCTNFIFGSLLFSQTGFIQSVKGVFDLTLTTGSKQALQMVNIPRTYRFFVTMHTNQTCWKCQRSLDSQKEQFFCECGVIQPPNIQRTFFEVLGLDTSFDIEQRELTQKFRQLQSSLHPDKFTQKSAEEEAYSEQQSALVNKAYSTLQKPLSRGLYLLELYGDPLEEHEINLDSEFLMEIMEINEKLANANSLEVIHSIHHENTTVLNDLTAQLARAFKQKNITKAKEILARLQYFTNIDDKVKQVLHQFASYR